MMKKTVPLSLLLASSALAQNPFAGTWTPGASNNAPVTGCCYYTGAVTGTGASATGAILSGTTDTNTITSTAGSADGTTTPPVGPCGWYLTPLTSAGANAPMIATGGTSATFKQTLGTATAASDGSYAVNNNVAAATTKQGLGGTWTLNAAADTLTFTPSINAGSGSCNPESFTRTTTAVTGADGTYTAEAGVAGASTNSATCCFLDTATPVVVATSGTRTTVTGKTGTCTTGGSSNYSKGLKSSGTTGTYNDFSGVQSFTVNSDGSVTYSPTGVTSGANACTQKLTKNSSGGVHLASIMTPVVVGGAMLGLVAV